MSKGAQGGGPGRTEPAGADLRRIRDLASRGNVIPVVREVPADLQTPVVNTARRDPKGRNTLPYAALPFPRKPSIGMSKVPQAGRREPSSSRLQKKTNIPTAC